MHKTEQPVYEANFAGRSWVAQDAVTTTHHAHDFEAPDGGLGWFHLLEVALKRCYASLHHLEVISTAKSPWRAKRGMHCGIPWEVMDCCQRT